MEPAFKIALIKELQCMTGNLVAERKRSFKAKASDTMGIRRLKIFKDRNSQGRFGVEKFHVYTGRGKGFEHILGFEQ